MSEPVTSEDFQLLIQELKNTNKKLDQKAKSGIGAIGEKITDRFKSVGDSIKSPFVQLESALKLPFDTVSNTIESVGEAVMQPFESFKNVTQGFKNLFGDKKEENQSELLGQILEEIRAQTELLQGNRNREQNKDLIKSEQTKEQQSTFKSIADNIKKSGADAVGRGARRRGKSGAGGGQGGLTQNLISDFFLASIVSQRGIGEFIEDTKKNIVLVRKFLLDKPFKKTISGIKQISRGAINLAKDIFGIGQEKGQTGFPFRRVAVKEKVASVVDKVKGLKERFFPNPPQQIMQPAPGEFDTSTALRTGEPKNLRLESVSETFRERSDSAQSERIFNDAAQQELFSEDIVKSNFAIVEAVKANTSQLVKALTGNDLKRAETEKERDQTFQNIADSLDNIEGGDRIGDGQSLEKAETSLTEKVTGVIETVRDIALTIGSLTLAFRKRLPALLSNVLSKGKGLFNRLNPFSRNKPLTGKPSTGAPMKNVTPPRPTLTGPTVPSPPAVTGPAKTIVDAGNAGRNASSNVMKNITGAPGTSVVDVAPKPRGGFFSRFNLNPMNRIKDATKGLAKQFPSVLKRVPVIGPVVEGIFLNSSIKSILEDPEASEDEKKKAVGTEFIKALTGPAGAAIAIGAVTAATGGVGLLGAAVTGTAGYAIGKVVGGILASVLPTKTIGGAIINTFYKDEAKAGGMNMDSAQGPITPEIKPQTTTENPVKEITQEVKEKRFAASRVAVKEAQAALDKFEAENQGAEMIEAPRDMFDDPDDDPILEYKDPEKQAQFEKLRSKVFDAEYDRTENARNVMGLKDAFTGANSSRDTFKTIDFIQDRFGIQFPGFTESADGGTSNYVGSGAAIQFAQDLFAKNPNATGAEMLQAIQSGADIAAEMRASAQSSRDELEKLGIINAPTRNNVVNTTINEAPKHIDRTTQMFGLQPAYSADF